jgi:penicillin G amidase
LDESGRNDRIGRNFRQSPSTPHPPGIPRLAVADAPLCSALASLVTNRDKAGVNPLLVIALLWLSLAMRHDAVAAPPAAFGQIEVLRDVWGIPHVFSDTDAGAFYGLGYATAEQRGFQMTYSLRSIQGRLAEILGDPPHPTGAGTVPEHDRKMRHFGWSRAAEQITGRLDAATLTLLEAYSAGVNDSFAAQQIDGTLHPLFAQLEVEPERWTPAACLLSWWQLGRFFATDGTRDLLAWRNRDRAPANRESTTALADGIDDESAVVQRGDVSVEWIQKVEAFHNSMQVKERETAPTSDPPTFSHAWVVGGSRTSTGAAVLVSDPRTPVRDPSLFMEFHISGASFNARGVGVPGSPILLVGFNPHVAWGMTALGADQADLFLLETDPERPDQYRWNGSWRPMNVCRERLQIKGQPDQMLTIRETHLGPVVSDFVFRQAGEPEVALKRVPLTEMDRETIQGSLAMIRAEEVDQFNQALAGWRFPTVHCVFGDRSGRIGYSVAGAIPIRAPGALDSRGSYAMAGWMSAHDWQGYVPYELLPQVRDPARGLLFSANHQPIGSFYPIPLGIGTGAIGDTIRSWRLREVLSGQDRFHPSDVLAIHFDTTNPARRDIVRLGIHLQKTQPEHLSKASQDALLSLTAWLQDGATCDLRHPGASLATRVSTFFRPGATALALRHGGGESGIARFLRDAIARVEADPKAILSDEERRFVDRALATAWSETLDADGAPTPRRTNGSPAATGTIRWFDTLDGFGSLNPKFDLPMANLTCLDGQTILSQATQAYTQWVPLHDVDLAKSICPIGHSDRPDDPHRTSTLELWTEAALHPAPLTRAAVDRITRDRVLLSKPNR